MCSFEQQRASDFFDAQPGVHDGQPLTPSAQSDCSPVVFRSRSWADFDFDDEIELLARSSANFKDKDLTGKTDSTSTCSGSDSSESADMSKACAPHLEQDGACQWVPVAMVSPDGQMSPMAVPGYPQGDWGSFGFQPARASRKAGGKKAKRSGGRLAAEGQMEFSHMAHNLLGWSIGNVYANFQANFQAPSDAKLVGATPSSESWGDPCDACWGKVQRLSTCIANFDGSPASWTKLQRLSETLFSFRNSPMMPKAEQADAALGTFDGDCRNCGKRGHKKSNCPEFDKVMNGRRAASGNSCPYCGSCPPPAESQP